MSRDYRIVFFGTAEISVAAMNAIHAAGFELAAVVTQPDKTRGRNRKQLYPPAVKVRAEELGLRVFQPTSCKDEDFLSELAAIDADAFCVFAFGQILPQKLLDMPRHGCFNAHASLLPRWRGAAPINWAIIEGDERTGMSIQRMVAKLDSGPVCWTKEVPIAKKETAATLYEKLIPLAGEGLVATLDGALAENLEFAEQDHEKATYARLMSKEDGLIDWSKSAQELDRQIRGVTPWPGAFARYDGNLVKMFDPEPVTRAYQNAPGEVIQLVDNGIVIACGDGALVVHELQRQGKKCMCADAFVCGCRLKVGDRFENGKL